MRVIFYYISRNLGHSRRIFSLAKGIKRDNNKASISVFQTGGEQGHFPFKKYADFRILPFSTNPTTLSTTLKKRISLLIKTIEKFKPDIFITELYPFGQDYFSRETPYILKYLRENSQTKIISSISYLIWGKDALEVLKKYYDYVFCHFPLSYLQTYFSSSNASEDGRFLFKEILRYFKDRIYFTGFVLDKETFLPSLPASQILTGKRKKRLTLVSIGGGGEKDKQIVILKSLSVAEKMKDYFFIVVAGAQMLPDIYDKLYKIAQRIPNVRLIRHTRKFIYYLRSCDLSINMAGYNTIVETLWLKKKSIIIPYKTEEQRVRADFVRKIYGLPIIPLEKLTPDILYANINKEFKNRERIDIRQGDFKGIENTIKLLEKIKGEKYLC